MKDKLPKSYLKYINQNGLMEGEADFEFGGYFILEPLDSLNEFNNNIEIEEHAPGLIAFGVDGSNEVFAFDEKGHIYLLPMIGMSKDGGIKVCDSWNEYEKKIKS